MVSGVQLESTLPEGNRILSPLRSHGGTWRGKTTLLYGMSPRIALLCIPRSHGDPVHLKACARHDGAPQIPELRSLAHSFVRAFAFALLLLSTPGALQPRLLRCLRPRRPPI